MTTVRSRPVLCLGEALVDVVIQGTQRSEHVGGSLLNVAAGLVRLEHPCQLATWIGRDAHGQMIIDHAHRHGVDLIPGSDGSDHTSVAHVHLDAGGRASYDFDLLWDVPEIPGPDSYGHLHCGSLAATVEPGGTRVLQVAKRMAQIGTVSFDPNIRPTVMISPERVVGRIEELVGLSDVVKASDEDLAWLYPDTPVEQVIRRWSALGPGLVVATRGPRGAWAVRPTDSRIAQVDPMDTPLVDTIGAGDSFMAGLLSGLLDADLLGSANAKIRLHDVGWPVIKSALDRATITSGLTVAHPGAYSPTRKELNRVVAVKPALTRSPG